MVINIGFGRIWLPHWYAMLSAVERRMWWLCFSLLVIVFSPSKELGQLAALFSMIGLIGWVRVLPSKHIARAIILGAVYTGLGILYWVLTPHFSFINHYLFFVTISAVWLLGYDLRPVATGTFLRALSYLILSFLLVQTVYGIWQAGVSFITYGYFDLSVGDYVRGTIEPGSGATVSGSNQMFAILLTSLLLFAIATQPPHLSNGRLAIYALALVTWLTASVFHTFLFLGVAIVISFVILRRLHYWRLSRPSWVRTLQTTIFLGGLCTAAAFITIFLPRNLSHLPYLLQESLNWQDGSHKAKATYNTLYNVPQENPWQPLIGLGLGQYASRAALIRTGEYLRGANLSLPVHVNPLTEKYILSLWRTFFQKYPNGGSTYFPYYSWLSLYGELGIVGLGFVGCWIVHWLFSWRRVQMPQFPQFPQMMIVLALYMAFLGFQDNYWEFVQAVTPAFLFMSLGQAYARQLHI